MAVPIEFNSHASRATADALVAAGYSPGNAPGVAALLRRFALDPEVGEFAYQPRKRSAAAPRWDGRERLWVRLSTRANPDSDMSATYRGKPRCPRQSSRFSSVGLSGRQWCSTFQPLRAISGAFSSGAGPIALRRRCPARPRDGRSRAARRCFCGRVTLAILPLSTAAAADVACWRSGSPRRARLLCPSPR